MNWKASAETDLRTYNFRRQSLDNIQERITALKTTQDGLRAAAADSEPVKGGTSKREDKLINCIVEIERLKINYAAANRIVKLIEKGLAGLSEEEREVVDAFYISGVDRCVDVLRERLGYEKSQIYRLRERALYKFTVSCYGIIDL